MVEELAAIKTVDGIVDWIVEHRAARDAAAQSAIAGMSEITDIMSTLDGYQRAISDAVEEQRRVSAN